MRACGVRSYLRSAISSLIVKDESVLQISLLTVEGKLVVAPACPSAVLEKIKGNQGGGRAPLLLWESQEGPSKSIIFIKDKALLPKFNYVAIRKGKRGRTFSRAQTLSHRFTSTAIPKTLLTRWKRKEEEKGNTC